jgi:hypothetical protein
MRIRNPPMAPEIKSAFDMELRDTIHTSNHRFSLEEERQGHEARTVAITIPAHPM